MKNLSKFRLLFLVTTVIVLVGTFSIVYASDQRESTVYRICVDQRGNMRLLLPDGKGNYRAECKQNELMIELPSNRRVSELIAALDAKLNELGDNITDTQETISVLESIVSEQGGKIIELEGMITGQGDEINELEGVVGGLQNTVSEQQTIISEFTDNITTFWGSITDLESTVNEQADNITALWERIAELEGNSGNGTGTDDIVTEGLALYLPLWHPELTGGTIVSKDPNAHSCTVTGAVWTSQGRSFDGTDDKITIANHPALNITGALTLEAWARCTLYTAAGTVFGSILEMVNAATPTDNYDLLLTYNAVGPTLTLYFVWYNGAYQTTSVDNGWIYNQWCHYVVTYNYGTVTLYRDGVNIKSESGKLALISSTGNTLQIGKYAVGSQGWFKDMIGEVRIYNRALTPEEIQQNYLATKSRYE